MRTPSDSDPRGPGRPGDTGGGASHRGMRITIRPWPHREGFKVIVWTGTPGCRARRVITRRTFAEAVEEQGRLMAAHAVESGGEAPKGVPTVGWMMRQFIAVKQSQPKLSDEARAAYRYHGAAIIKTIGHVPLRSLARAHVEAHMDARLAQKLSPATITDEVAQLRMALGHAREQGWRVGTTSGDRELCGSLPMHEPPAKRWLQKEEVERVLAEVDATGDASLGIAVRLALLGGLRYRECLTREWSDVDWRGRALRVGPKAAVVTGGRLFRTKSRKTRYVPIDSALLDVLRARWIELGRPREGWIAPRRDGRYRRGKGWICQGVKAACGRAGLPAVTCHELRHSFASLSLEAGVPMEKVQLILGHSDLAITAKRYAHISARKLAGAVDQTRAYLDEAPDGSEEE